MNGESVMLSFGAGPYAGSLDRICEEGRTSGLFTSVIAIRPEDLAPDFWSGGMTPEAALRTAREFWSWRWKPRIILEQLETLPEGATLLYVDAGCTINPKGRARFEDYRARALTSDHGIAAFALPDHFTEGKWTNGDVFHHFDARHLRNTAQIYATFMMFSRTDLSLGLVQKWKYACEEIGLADDTKGTHPCYPEFEDHRHDQSVFSFLCKLNEVRTFENESDKYDNFPVWATRRRSN